MSVTEKVLDAIELLTKDSVAKAGYDRTIQAQILSCEDETTGKYRCRYQDATFFAYSNSADVTYSKGTSVYILVPANDMSKDKTIIGSVAQMGVNYISQVNDSDVFYDIGENYISESDNVFYLDTSIQKYVYKIYDAKNKSNDVSLSDMTNDDIKNAKYIRVGVDIQTNIPKQRRYNGSYGIAFQIQFSGDNDNNNTIITTSKFIIDQDDIQGDPYNIPRAAATRKYFDFWGQRFIRIKSIYIFNNDFYGSSGESSAKLTSGDIELSNLEFYVAGRLTQEELNGISMVVNKRTMSNNVVLFAEVRQRGKIVTNNNISFYWGRQRSNITANSEYYNKQLGRGWQCLNDYNKILADKENPREWVPGGNQYTVNLSQIQTKETKFKVVAVYNNNIISQQITINKQDGYSLSIVSKNNKTIFYKGSGSTDLTCLIDGADKGNDSDYKFYWSNEVNNNNLIEIAAPQANKNKLLNVRANQFNNIGIYYCSVYYKQQYIGTAQIKLMNKEQVDGAYSLVLNNGTVAFQYNENGYAPTKETMNPQIIKALSFTLYDEQGNEISAKEIINSENGLVRWEIPINNTLLIDDNQEPGQIVRGYCRHEKLETFLYDIAYIYDISKVNNQIILTVHYNDIKLTTKTNFVFTKQGNPGTNGTEYVVVISPKKNYKDTISQYPTLTLVEPSTYWLDNQSINTNTNINDYFNVSLYNDSESIDIGSSQIKWEILRNKYTSTRKDLSLFDDSSGHIRINKNISIKGNIGNAYANILKCTITYNGKKYYNTLPIACAWVSNNKYRVRLEDNTGFRYVVYAADGTRPQYAHIPFKFNLTGADNITYTAGAVGNTQATNSATLNNTELLTTTDKTNPFTYNVKETYNGLCTNAAATCIFKQNNTTIGVLNVPIHFLLNKYGFAGLNDWDGNSIQLNNNTGYILAPQVGAGSKQDNNSFSGVLMGQIHGSQINKTGLFGLNNGQATFFISSDDGSVTLGKTDQGQIIVDPTNGSYIYFTSLKGKIYSGTHDSLNSTNEGFYLDHTGISIGNGFKVTKNGELTLSNQKSSIDLPGGVWNSAGLNLGGGKFKADKDGNVTASNLSITGGEIKLGNSNSNPVFHVTNEGIVTAKKINITGGSIQGPNLILGGKSNQNGKLTVKNASGQDIGTWDVNGINISGGEITLGGSSSNPVFHVTNEGSLTATAGKIGNFVLADGRLIYNGTSVSQSVRGAEISQNGITFTSPIKNQQDGGNYAKKVILNENGISFFKNNVLKWQTSPQAAITINITDLYFYTAEDSSGNLGHARFGCPATFHYKVSTNGGISQVCDEINIHTMFHTIKAVSDRYSLTANTATLINWVAFSVDNRSGYYDSFPDDLTIVGIKAYNTDNAKVSFATANSNGAVISNNSSSAQSGVVQVDFVCVFNDTAARWFPNHPPIR